MRTPGAERAHVAGFCLTEGFVDRPEDILSIDFYDGECPHLIAVRLAPARQAKAESILNRRRGVAQTRAGSCREDLPRELRRLVAPADDGQQFSTAAAAGCFDTLSAHQVLRRETAASHAAAVFDRHLELLAVAEDVGRHNAVDKVIGELFLDHRLSAAAMLVLSSRIASELVQKAARARIPVVLAVSRPTSLAVEIAARLNMTLACLAREGGMFIFCGAQRFQAD
jgi:FdhD protein